MWRFVDPQNSRYRISIIITLLGVCMSSYVPARVVVPYYIARAAPRARERSLQMQYALSDMPVALMMAAIGFHADTSKIGLALYDRQNSQAFFATLLSTTLVVPSAAIAVVTCLPDLPAEAVLGIFIVSLIPGGPLANIAAIVTGANKELNILLTSCEMLLSAVLVPVGLMVVLPHVVSTSQLIEVPFAEQIHGIALVVVPLVLGVLLNLIVGQEPTQALVCGLDPRRLVLRALAFSALTFIAVAKFTHLEQDSIFVQAIPLIRAVSLPPLTSVYAAMLFGCVTVGWSFLLGLLIPAQPLANRISMCLEVGVRDLTFGLVIAMTGLPSLLASQRADVVIAVLLAWGTCNWGVVIVALVACACGASSHAHGKMYSVLT